MWTWIVEFQREIYLAFAAHIKAFSIDGGWAAFLVFLPMGIVFGSVHAMTPGHSKILLATYLTGSSSGIWRALATSTALSATHVTVSVLIVLLSLPLVEVMFGGSGPGSSPVLENLSRGLLGLIGIWMIWRGLLSRRHAHHHQREGVMFGIMAGLIPCPLTLFIMSFSVLHGVVIVGIMFAITMMIGIGLTLSVVAIASVVFGNRLVWLLDRHPRLLDRIGRTLETLAGLALVAVACFELARASAFLTR